MGAEEYGFGTIAMIAEGCIMARICHTNKCPVGGMDIAWNWSLDLPQTDAIQRVTWYNSFPHAVHAAVTTQNEALRKRFPGVPGDVVKFFGFVAEEVRHILAKLGTKSFF